jgi:hypothetical protein
MLPSTAESVPKDFEQANVRDSGVVGDGWSCEPLQVASALLRLEVK